MPFVRVIVGNHKEPARIRLKWTDKVAMMVVRNTVEGVKYISIMTAGFVHAVECTETFTYIDRQGKEKLRQNQHLRCYYKG